MTEFLRPESEIFDCAAIARSVAVLQTQNAELQAELAQCRQELAKAAHCTLETPLHLSNDCTATANPVCFPNSSILEDLNSCSSPDSEVKGAKAVLSQSEEWLRLAIDLNHISLWSLTLATGKLAWTENCYRLLGYVPGEVEPSYERWRDRLHPDDRERVETTFAQATQIQTACQIEYRIIHPDGSIHWIVDRARWSYDSAGQAVQMLGAAIDITERKAIEEAFHDLNDELERHVQAQTQQLQASEASLRRQEQEFRTLAENSPDGIFRFDLAFRYLYLNPAAAKTLGLPQSVVLGKSDRELSLPAESVTFWEQTLRTVMQTQTLLTVDFSMSAPNGERWFQSHNIPEFDVDGNLISILVIERDITTLKQTEAALRQGKQRFQRLAANIPGVIFQFRISTDGDRTLPYVSPQFEALFGISAATVEQDAEVFVQCCHPDDRASLEAATAESFATLNSWQWEGRFISPLGQVVWIQGVSNPERQPNGDMLWDGVLLDVSEAKRGEAEYKSSEVDRLRLEAERQQAVEALQYSEEQLRIIFENAPIAISLADAYDYRIVRVNAAHRQLLGYSDEELAKMTFVDFTYPDDVFTNVNCIQRLIEGDQSRFQMDKRFIKKNGDVVWTTLTVALIRDRDGNPRYSLGMFQDSTAAKQREAERQQAENALRQSEEQFRAFFENAPIAIGLATMNDQRMVRSNAKYQELLGYSDPELCQMTFLDLTHPDDVTTDLKLFYQLLAGLISRFQMEKRYIRKNGDIIWVNLTVALIYDPDGKPLYSLCMPQDITEAKRLDAERHQTEEALRRSQASLAEAQRVAHVGSWEVDPMTQQGTWSAELFRLFGLDPDQPKPPIEQIIQLIHPDDRAMYCQVIDQAFGQGEPHAVDHRLIRPDGSCVWLSSLGQVERNAAGQVTRLFGVALDITARKQAEETLRQQAAREHLLRSISQNIYQSLELDEVLTVAVNEVRQTLQADRALIFHLTTNGSGVILKESVVSDYPTIAAMWFEDEHFPPACHDLYLQGNSRIVSSTALDGWGDCLVEFMQQTQVQSKIVAPIVHRSDAAVPHLWGLLIVHACAEKRQWLPAEADLMQQIANQLAISIQQANLYRQVQTELGDRKQAEASLRKSLQEKEVLLKEVHHRVKNNLQIVSSLLRMQSRKVDSLQTFKVLQESQNRVQSMALIHEQLYQSSDLAEIDLSEYLHSLVNNLFSSYGISYQQVTLSIETNGTYLNLNTAIPCGLIINELISNSLKYAFPANQLGEIRICVTSVLDESLNEYKGTLLVMDNGIGIPTTIDWQNSPSLGMRIVRNLVHQIKGDITLLPGTGTAFQITFPITDET
ncbi:PAS domain S-box protein [Phormidium sp. CLA17]|uniref:PAS domain S-box protein n=1 Tax=Leptolyngbya sp. Cla-17 TaxID=2803751 RepID=UPI001491E917|nr:PAS domain S-box protein [Leptolyngbya sp. Cla-17]MBM0743771.1 PAS domain S-box protein [Leptolyngbya sp. Cla-17]